MKSRCFFKSTATHVTSAALEESSVEMDEVNWEDFEERKCVVSLTGRSPFAFPSDGGIELRRCGFGHFCLSVKCNPPNKACLWISSTGSTLLHSQATFKLCSSAFSNAFISATRVSIHETCFVECVSTAGKGGGCTARDQVTENVVLLSCQSRSTPTSVLVSLSFDSDLRKVVDADERQKDETRRGFIV
ncbi:hypothetical protein BLNAU_3201 [Blattamonas nauphoetae]|uniref:Uncharacterized protein n=1 Tax=Blattamonas nauphoetae TaxID=2049346 RepID=A0ABQ9YDF5_9EUKA|nr:hypothetical protein BLNAU_3201 [Blattamonas nauphoetae]